jgi:AraC family transcriptional regulator
MDAEKESAFRILSRREGIMQPMFDATPIGPLSPSPSLLVERRDLEPISWQSHLLEDQLLHFFMKPAVIGYSLKDAAIAEIPVAPGQAVLEKNGTTSAGTRGSVYFRSEYRTPQ